MEDARVWACWNYSLVMHLNYPGPVSRFFLILNPQGAPSGGCSSWPLDGDQSLLLTEMAGNIFFFCPQPPRIHPPHCWLSSPSNKPYLICYCCCLVAKLCPTLWSAARQAFLSFTISWSLFKLISAESVMLYNHLTLCCSLLLLPSIFPSIRVFSNESALRISWPKYWSFSFSNRPSNEYSGLISFRMDWFDLLAVQGTLKSLLQHHSSKASILWHSAFFIVQLSHPYMTIGKTIALTRQTFVSISH